jgi:excisionase family DNA binding protein
MKVLNLKTSKGQSQKKSVSNKLKRLQESINARPELVDLFIDLSNFIEHERLILIDTYPGEDLFLKVEEVEKLLGLSRPTCNALLDDGKILGFKTEKGHRRFSKKSVLSYLEKILVASSAKDRFYEETKAEDWEL